MLILPSGLDMPTQLLSDFYTTGIVFFSTCVCKIIESLKMWNVELFMWNAIKLG